MGQPYHSYNCRQSNPNVRADVQERNRRLSQAGDEAFAATTRSRRSRGGAVKSAPASRAATPTRIKQRDRALQQQQQQQQESNNYVDYDEDEIDDQDRLSFESRYDEEDSQSRYCCLFLDFMLCAIRVFGARVRHASCFVTHGVTLST